MHAMEKNVKQQINKNCLNIYPKYSMLTQVLASKIQKVFLYYLITNYHSDTNVKYTMNTSTFIKSIIIKYFVLNNHKVPFTSQRACCNEDFSNDK